MSTFRITKRTVDAAQAADRDTYVWDGDLRGFGLKVTPAGRKVFLVQYRLGGRAGRTRRYTIGSFGPLTPDEARVEAKRVLGVVAAGRDPAEEKQERMDRKTLGALLEQFLWDHVDAKLKSSTAGEYRRLARLYVSPSLRQKPVDEVQRADIERLHISLRDKPYQGNRTLALLSKFFNWCEKHGHRADATNPCRHVTKYRERKRERFLDADELNRLGEALTAAERSQTVTVFAVAAIRLLALTGARLSEVLTLRWEYVDRGRSAIRLPLSKTGEKSIFLSEAARDVLEQLPRLAGNPFVICGERPGAHLVNLQKAWRRIRAAAGLDEVRIHDLRHSYASMAAASGQSLYMIGSLLGHRTPQTTQRYAHLAADPLRAANEIVGGKIDEAMKRRSAE